MFVVAGENWVYANLRFSATDQLSRFPKNLHEDAGVRGPSEALGEMGIKHSIFHIFHNCTIFLSLRHYSEGRASSAACIGKTPTAVKATS